MTLDSARQVAERVLGLAPSEPTDPAAIHDAVGELLNIIAGNFKSNLCDAGLDCRLHTPTVTRTDDRAVHTVPGGVEHMAFSAAPIVLLVDLAVNPWHGG